MKKFLILMAAVFTFTMASAQNDDAKKERGMKKMNPTEMMTKRYQLDESQTAKVEELNNKYKDLFRGGRPGGRRHHGGKEPGNNGENVDGATGATTQQANQRPSREEMQKRMKEREEKQAAYDEELKGIMTADQFAAYQKDQAERKNHRHGGPRKQE